MLSLAPTILLSAGAGICFAAMGLAYRWGGKKNVAPKMVFWGAAVLGAAVFLFRAIDAGELFHTPLRVILWALVWTFGQYAAVGLMALSMKRGAFGPIWCALTLNFIPVALFVIFLTDEPATFWPWVAMTLAIACIIVASFDPSLKKSSVEQSGQNKHNILIFALLLLLLMLANGIGNVGMKDLRLPHPPDAPHLPAFSDSLMGIFYAAFVLAISVEWLVLRKKVPCLKTTAGPALLSGIGSLLGTALIMQASGGPSFLPFIVSGILSVLGGFLGAAVFFKDKLTWISWIVIALGIASVICTAF